MKKVITLVLALVCVLGLVGCDSTKYTCNAVTSDDNLDFQPSTLSEPFVTNEERDELLNKAVRDYLDDLGEKSVSFTYEITDTHLGVVENKETILYWVKIVYGDGFSTVIGFIVQ